MLRYLKSSFWSFLSIFIRTIGSLGINKLMALYYGPNGITLYAHFQNLVSIITTVPDGGVNIGIIKHLATAEPASNTFRAYFWGGVWLSLLSAAAALAFVFSISGFDVFKEVVPPAEQGVWVLLFITASLLIIGNLYLQAILLSKRVLTWHVVSTSTMSFAGLGAVYFLGGKVTVAHLMPLVLLAQSLTFFLMLPLLYFKKIIFSLKQLPVPRLVYRELGKYILMALSAVVCLKLTDFIIRDFVIVQFDLYETGLWQAVVRVSENYSVVYSAVFGMLFYPQMAARAQNQEALQKYVKGMFYLILPGLATALGLVYLLREWVLRLLFNEAFVVAEYLFPYQLLGDFFKLWSVVLTSLIVLQANVRLYIWWQVLAALLYMGLVYLLLPAFGLKGITMAHAIRFGAVLCCSMVYFNKYIRL